jgi:DNA uptake protein ComE-like DNA-binding protein
LAHRKLYHLVDKGKKLIDPRLYRAITLLAAIFFVVLLVRYFSAISTSDPPSPAPVIVEVLGAVNKPGIHLVESQNASSTVTVGEAIEAAGGLSKHTPGDIPLSFYKHEVQSGERISVTGEGETPPHFSVGPMDGGARLTLGKKLDLNQATEEELSLIPKMKPQFAVEIVKRRQGKRWNSVQELEEIAGVGPKTVEKWQDYLEANCREPIKP